jgi:hypothetical protein
VSIVDAFVRIMAEAVTIGNGILDAWVYMPANAASPLDVNATLSTSGNNLVDYIASSALTASEIMCSVVNALF